MEPAIFKQRNTIQLSYELPHYVHTSTVYPAKSPNGSRIIIYGHEEGIRIIWYGGRSYKQPNVGKPSVTDNGTSKDEAMVIDLSDDDDPPPPPSELVEFEREDGEVDLAEPYPNVLRFIDIELGTSAIHLAVPNLSPTQADSSSELHAPMLSSQLVVAVACADLTIRLISLPLAPPAKSSNEPSSWKMQAISIPASSGHQDFITSISIKDYAEAHDVEGDGDPSKSRSRSGVRAKRSRPASGLEWSFLLASSSCTGSGLLLIHKISVSEQNEFDQSPEGLFPTQRQLLRSPLSACKLSFNPSPHPADRASNLLVMLPDTGCVKVYQAMPQSAHARGRRGSGATMDSATSSAGSVRGSSRQPGRSQVTLYSSFLPPSEGEPFGRRKGLLDASWVLGGRAILVLFENGDWGVWDLEAAGPPSAAQTQNLVKGQSSVSGIQGGAQTRLTIRGSIVPFSNASTKSNTEQTDLSDTTALAPMTPHTRKTRSDRFFERKEGDLMAASENSTASRGSISVTELPQSLVTQSLKVADESVLLSYGDSSFHLPSLLTFWRAEVSGRGTFGNSSPSRPNPLPPLRLCGQHVKTISQFPTEKADFASDGTSAYPEILATTDHSLVLLLMPLMENVVSQVEHNHSLAARLPGTSTSTNELLLERGELGIDGLDNMLNDMTNGTARKLGKSLGFDVDENMDITMRTSIGTPTPKLTGRSRSVRGTPSAAFRPGHSKVRLFS